MFTLLRKAIVLSLVFVAGVILGAASPAHAGTGSTGGGYPTMVMCRIVAPGVWFVALGRTSYADPFLDGRWAATGTLGGYISVRGCYPDTPWGSATHSSYSTRLIVLRYDPWLNGTGGWVSCGDSTDFTTGDGRTTSWVSYGPLSWKPAWPCWYVNWPAGWTYITGHWNVIVSPTTPLWGEPTYTSLVNYGFYV